MKWKVIILVGTPLWSNDGFDFELGRFRWLWLAKLRAWWHIANHPFREAGISLIEPNDQGHVSRPESGSGNR